MPRYKTVKVIYQIGRHIDAFIFKNSKVFTAEQTVLKCYPNAVIVNVVLSKQFKF